MKNIYLAILALALIASSCSKDFLDTKSPQINDDEYFNNESDVNSALTACYTILSWEDGTSYYQYWVADVLSHDAYKGGEGAGDQQWMEPLLQFDYSAASYSAELQAPYKSYYVAINRCNRFIDKVSALSTDIISDTKKKETIAEAKFLRGVYYFELAKMFGSVSIVTHVLTQSEYNVSRSPVDSVYKQIETDFKEAQQELPLKSGQDVGRATKGAAQAYLCKTFIYEKKWSDALAWADSVIKSNQYSLEDNYTDNWLLDNENGKESVFEIQFAQTGNASLWGDDNQGNMFSIFTRSRNDNNGYGFCCPTKDFVSKYETGDPRLKATIIADGDTLWKGTSDEYIANNQFSSCIDHYMTKKYQLPASERGVESDDPNNWKLIRYAEVLLWRAEAAYHCGGDWQSYLQKVRDRVGMGVSPYINDPLNAIYHEREVELGMEGHSFWDILREGRGEEVLGKYGYKEASNRYYPIPASQQ